MITVSRELLRQFLDEAVVTSSMMKAYTALRNALEQPAVEPFGWVKSSEIESSIRFGGSINLWRKQYDCDVPMYAAPQAQQPPRIGAGVTVEQTLEHWEHDFQNPMTPEQQADWVKREREFAVSQAQQPEINQCDGCRSGQEMRGSLHIDRHGKPTMVCQASKYQPPEVNQ